MAGVKKADKKKAGKTEYSRPPVFVEQAKRKPFSYEPKPKPKAEEKEGRP